MAWKGQEYSWARLWCQLPLAEVQAVVGEQKNTRLRSELQLPYRAEGTQKKEHCESHSLSIKLLEFCFSTGAEHETQSLSRFYLTVWKHRHFDKLQIHITEAWLWDCKNLFKLTQARSCWAQQLSWNWKYLQCFILWNWAPQASLVSSLFPVAGLLCSHFRAEVYKGPQACFWIKTITSKNHRITGFGRDVWRSSPTLCYIRFPAVVTQEGMQMDLEHLHRRRLPSLSRQPVPVLCHFHSKQFLTFRWSFPCSILWRLPHVLLLYTTEKSLSPSTWLSPFRCS